MKIIDAHLHLFPSEPGTDAMAEAVGHVNSVDHLRQIYGALNMVHGVVMGNRSLEVGFHHYPRDLFHYCVGLDSLVLRRGSHIRMTALDGFLPKGLLKFLDILADVAVCILAVIMIVVGWRYTSTLGGRGTYVSMPWLSRFWMYFPVPLAGVAMVIFELEAIYNHIKAFFVKEGVNA